MEKLDWNFNKKNILEKMGKGTFGTVYSYLLEEKKYAIKKIKNESKYITCAKFEINVLSYLNQYKIKKNIKDFPIIDFNGYFIDNKIYFLVFELLDYNLYQYNRIFREEIDENIIDSISYDLALGLSYIHKHFIHMDLKMENIMINYKTKNIKIIDFGSSQKKVNIFQKKYFYVQTRYYRSPEIFFNLEDYNEKIDIWSYGCIIAELLINKPLFNGKTKDVLCSIVNKIGFPKHTKYLICKKYQDLFYDEYHSMYIKDIVYAEENENGEELDWYLNNYTEKVSKFKKKLYIKFLRSILIYNFSKRPGAEECLNDIVFIEHKIKKNIC
tara:strand:- start:70 stop:1050 length:981 start_codon:yes stop_codon:yes gene_type:complete